jgi:hypothetical protein
MHSIAWEVGCELGWRERDCFIGRVELELVSILQMALILRELRERMEYFVCSLKDMIRGFNGVVAKEVTCHVCKANLKRGDLGWWDLMC